MTRTQQADSAEEVRRVPLYIYFDSAEEVRHVPLYIYFDSSLMDLSGID